MFFGVSDAFLSALAMCEYVAQNPSDELSFSTFYHLIVIDVVFVVAQVRFDLLCIYVACSLKSHRSSARKMQVHL